MLFLLSPSKDLNFESVPGLSSTDEPRLWYSSQPIVLEMKKKSAKQIKKLMDISDNLATLNVERYKHMSVHFSPENSLPAVFAFDGDVYKGLEARTLNQNAINYCEQHVRILSGLYGLLKPLDLIQAYRLEMGIPLKVGKSKNLYRYWSGPLNSLLQEDIKSLKAEYLINTASQEYFDVVDKSAISIPIINIHFREMRNGIPKFFSYTAKKARGSIVKYMALNNYNTLDELKTFNLDNYQFYPELSDETNLFFIK